MEGEESEDVGSLAVVQSLFGHAEEEETARRQREAEMARKRREDARLLPSWRAIIANWDVYVCLRLRRGCVVGC